MQATELELRVEEEEGATRIVGLIPFNSPSQDLGGFTERILPTAFANSLASGREIKALWNHDHDKPLAARSLGTLRLRQTDKGLAISIKTPDTSWGRDAIECVRSKLCPGMSFGFHTNKDNWTTEAGATVRELVDVDLHEVSAVFNPAYTASQVDLRSRPKPWQPSLAFLWLKQKQAMAHR